MFPLILKDFAFQRPKDQVRYISQSNLLWVSITVRRISIFILIRYSTAFSLSSQFNFVSKQCNISPICLVLLAAIEKYDNREPCILIMYCP